MKFSKIQFYEGKINNSISVTGTAFLYGIISLIFSIVIAWFLSTLLHFFHSDLHDVQIPSTIIGSIIAAYLCIDRFYQKHRRLFAFEEYQKITRLGTAAYLLYTIPIMIIMMLSMQDYPSSKLLFLFSGIIIGGLLIWGITSMSFRIAMRLKMFKL